MTLKPLLVAFLTLATTALAQTDVRAKTDKGDLQGKLSDDGSVRIFLGIPYAAPPVGPLRWKPPQPAARWKDTRNAQSYGNHCMQANKFADMNFHDPAESEDCLTLNIWTPQASNNPKLPVMVWIYGGGFYAGSTSERRQDGEAFARKGVVLVSMNYRLNIFGFFAHPALAAESPQHAAGNYGLMDQAAALQWVKRNIASFGGDPGNITLFGESAGSFSVSAQMASPLAKDTLAHAIGESGAAFSTINPLPFPTAAVAEGRGEAFARDILGKTSLADLRALPATDLVKALEAQKPPSVTRFGPDVDGLFLPQPVPDIYAAGKQAHIPLLAGWNRDEGGPPNPAITLDTYKTTAATTWGPNADAFLQAYSAENDEQAQRDTADLARDRFIADSTWEWIEAQVKTGAAPVYRFRFDRPSPGDRYHPKASGVFHSSEIEYVFGNLAVRPDAPFTPEDDKLSEDMQAYWVNFAKTGNPNGPNLPQWPPYNPSTDYQVMHFETTPAPYPDTTRPRYLFLRSTKPAAISSSGAGAR